MGGQRVARRSNGDRCSELDGIPVGAGRDRREGEGPAAELVSQLDRARVTGSEQLCLAGSAAVPDWADGVDDVTCRQVSGPCRLRVARLAAPEPAAFLQDGGAAGAMDRSVDPAAAEQARVRGVDDRVDVLLRDVAGDELDHAYAGRGKRSGRSGGSGMRACLNAVAR